MPQSLVSVASAIINTQSFVTDSCRHHPWAVTASSCHHPWALTASSHHQYSVVRHCNRAAAVAAVLPQSPFKPLLGKATDVLSGCLGNAYRMAFLVKFIRVIHEGETLQEIKVRIQGKLLVPDEEFAKWKFAFLSLGRP
ncbi:hypothetical protein WN944_024276 [Citrus x changshan-huyou]|uniref:ubiquitinyl hydrolase 1 n=1 Tax=Citrus x changshan-huyou TaxID=2935761 RepID=A0AAP0LNL4_9ROSI